MNSLNWELSILARAVAYPHLSAASSRVGISQPQLSRIVAKLEEQMNVVLLDRQARRKSSWTAAAHRLAEIYSATARHFQGELSKLVDQNQITHLRVGALAGLTDTALGLARQALQQWGIQVVELMIDDLNELEEAFLAQRLDLLFTSREPGKRKHRHLRRLGYQTLEAHNASSGALPVLSGYEYSSRPARQARTSQERFLVSNSLEARRRWIHDFGGAGTLPSPIRKAKSGATGEVPVLLLGSDSLPAEFWKKTQALTSG